MNLSDAQTITNNTGYITSLKVFTTNSDIVDTVASSIKSLHSEVTVTTQQDTLDQLQQQQSMYTSALESAQASIASTQATAIQEIIVVVAASSLIVLFVMLYTVSERTKEIGTLKAIGFSNKVVMGQFIIEGILLSAIAGVVGIAIASCRSTNPILTVASKRWEQHGIHPDRKRRLTATSVTLKSNPYLRGVRRRYSTWRHRQPVSSMESSKNQTSRGDEI